ncbi:helix-turn-helix domain-containing protein [Streptococcus suis]|uniref:helix-turn-helix domain-containing protein n=1 Tax=Streptococcus suis TaxID=1307 RepID=UPI001EF82BC2|nr:helix-turn-helix transcriptional regulator [Streptococcus suis]MCO8172646.1 helix-turn-helix transcriptional regulator [Streptococcus suis]MCO8181130.1 helix-turn-helix transcriptional regulator [Streptococcus suis]MCO8191762.1 helix-turn-helix transcriptional regulator [Streptococcus suis]MCO8202076.1 helix-turn-helix transcriptional regulator [Streptococcus suis]MCO8226506.1 helix-turn-helix transcriptional regulator [Streptococcus suis]
MNKLKTLRKENNLTQEELAKKIGVNLRTLQKWENGESSIRTKNAKKLADHFGVSVGYLLGYSDFREENELIEKIDETDFFGDGELTENGKDFFSSLDIFLYFALLRHHREQAETIANQIVGAYIQKDIDKKLTEKELEIVDNILSYVSKEKQRGDEAMIFLNEVLGVIKTKYDI